MFLKGNSPVDKDKGDVVIEDDEVKTEPTFPATLSLTKSNDVSWATKFEFGVIIGLFDFAIFKASSKDSL